MPPFRTLRRSRQRWLAGVCSGLAQWLGWPPLLVRVLFVAGSLIPIIPGFLVYVVLWVLVPKEDERR